MIAIFISEDEKEYSRYEDGAKSLGFLSTKLSVVINDPSKEQNKPNRWVRSIETCSVRCLFRSFEAGEESFDYVVIVECVRGGKVAEWKEALRDSKTPDPSGVRRLVHAIDECIFKTQKVVHLFIHFGGGSNPGLFEAPAENALRSTSHDFHVHAVSSTRSDLFAVKGEESITPPTNHDSLVKLIDKFDKARPSAGLPSVRDVMMGVVLGEKDELTVEEQKLIASCLVDKVARVLSEAKHECGAWLGAAMDEIQKKEGHVSMDAVKRLFVLILERRLLDD